jgi:hypothetical protein
MNIELYEQKINILYDYLNNNNFEDTYEIKKIDINKINLNDIELLEGKESSDILQYLLKQNLQYLFTINDDVYFKILSNNISTIMKISLNTNKLNDNLVSYVLSQLVLERKTNNILLPIVNLNVNLLDLKNLLQSIDNLPSIYDNYFDKNKKKIVSVKIRECFYNLTTLRNYIETENNIDYKILLFNIIQTLETIKLTYKNFIHNNLSLDNIFIYHKNTLNENNITINGITYNLPWQSYEIKLTNFEYSIITDSEIKLLNNLSFSSEKNNLSYLAKDILKINKNIDLSTKNFITKLRDMKNNNIETLSDEYFDEYIKKSEKDKSSYKGLRKLNTQFNSYLDSDNEFMLGQQRLIRTNKIQAPFKGKKSMIGGGEKDTVPPYKAEKNNPFRTNDERSTFNKKQDDVNKPRVPPVLVEQTIYDTTAIKSTPPIPPPVYVPVYDHNNQHMAIPFASNALNPALSQPVIKQYNVSLANPLHDFRTVSRIYEDVLPGDPRSFSFTTVYERKQLINFIRNLINNNTDGEDMIVTGGKNSLLSSMKLLDLNPYTVNKKPHLDLARNFLIFRAAYPIRYDQEKNNVYASKTAHGVNVRIYNISIGEMVGDEINQNLSNFDFNMWRELYYYKFILDNIIEKKISPNFISFILTKKDKLSNVNWSKLDMIQNKKNDDVLEKNLIAFKKNSNNKNDDIIIKLLYINNTNGIINKEFIKINDTLSVYPNIKIININPTDTTNLGLINKFNITSFPNILFKVDNEYIKYDGNLIIDDIIKFINSSIIMLDSLINLKNTSGESLILLTEAPHSNIIRWASPLYESSGALKKMITTGFHKAEVWESVLFQLMYILYILQDQKIYFEELSLENNIYIKDLFYDPNTVNYWIYNVDGLDYYVPNYGYLVLFDSKYSDLESGNYKIRSPNLYPNKNDKITNNNDSVYNFQYEIEIFNQFKNIFEPSIFCSQLEKMKCLKPDNVILDLLRNISNDNSTININEFIKKYYCKYLNNRIGKYLTRTEKETINILNRPTFNKQGDILIKQERYDEYKWVLFESNINNNNTLKNIINKDNNGLIINEKCNSYSLLATHPSEKVKPFGIEENKIIETYKHI